MVKFMTFKYMVSGVLGGKKHIGTTEDHHPAHSHTVTAWENASTGNNTSYDNIQPRQRSSPNTGCSTKDSPDLNEGPTPTYLIGRSSFLTEIPAAEGGQRMLLAYKLCTRASSEECSNIGALEKSTRCNGHFSFPLSSMCFSPFLCLPPTLSPRFSAAERRPPPSLTGVAEIILSDSSSCANALCCLRQPSLQAVKLWPQ